MIEQALRWFDRWQGSRCALAQDACRVLVLGKMVSTCRHPSVVIGQMHRKRMQDQSCTPVSLTVNHVGEKVGAACAVLAWQMSR